MLVTHRTNLPYASYSVPACGMLLEHVPGISDELLAAMTTRLQWRTARDVLTKLDIELSESLDIGLPEAATLLVTIASACVPLITPVSNCNSLRTVPSGISFLDKHFGGGIPCACLTEIVAPPGAGKTQFCMTVLAQTLLNVMSLDHSSVEMNDAETRAPVASAPYRCVYFDIERTFNADRFLQIFRHLRKSRGLPHISRRKVLEKILIFQPTSTSQFEAQLAWIEKNEMVYCDIDIVIVDSIASLKRKEFDFDNSSVRSNQLNHEAALLKRMASTYEIPVLITNHVTFDEKATMGTLWFHAVNHRIRLKYVGDHHASNPTGHNGMRMVVVEKSPLCGPVSGLVQIFEGGIRDDADRES